MNSDFENLSIEANESDFKYNFDTIYDEQKELLKKLLKALGSALLIYTIYNNILKLNSKEKVKIKSNLYKLISKSLEKQFDIENEATYELLKRTIINNYYKKLYILSLGESIEIKKLESQLISKIINATVKGEKWSNRIWNNKKELELLLKKDIAAFLDGKITVNDIKNKIEAKFNTNAYNTKRLTETEIARCQNEINEYFAKTYGLEYQKFLATLDYKTSDRCRSLDGQVFNINDPDKPNIPLHPFCRSCYINIPSRNWNPKHRMDNNIKNNDSVWKTYSEWYQENIGV